MAYDLLIKNGLIVDGSGMPAFRGDIGVRNAKIAEIGKLSGPATRTVDADGLAVSPGFIDNHAHYDGQVTWDPLCTLSPQHGATAVLDQSDEVMVEMERSRPVFAPGSPFPPQVEPAE